MSRSSIEKIDEQINMLKNKEFVDRPKVSSSNKRTKPRKVILEEPTVVDDLMSDLISDHEDTKVYGQFSDNNITPVSTKKVNNSNNIKTKKVVTDKQEVSKPITKKITNLDNLELDYNKIYDVYLPIGIGIIIVILILLIIFI